MNVKRSWCGAVGYRYSSFAGYHRRGRLGQRGVGPCVGLLRANERIHEGTEETTDVRIEVNDAKKRLDILDYCGLKR